MPTRAADAAALEARLAVVAEARDDAAERLAPGVEARAAGVVLEAGERPALAGLELALEQDVADHPPLARDRLVREEPDAGHVDAVAVAVAAAEQLVAAADGEHGGAARDRLLDCVSLRGEIRRDQRLLAILAAADVEEVVLARARARRRARPTSPRARARAARAALSTAMLPRSA